MAIKGYSLASLAAAVRKVISDLASHIGNNSNPHAVDKTDVGLGNVNNWVATGSVSDTSDTKYATAGAVQQTYARADSAYSLAEGRLTQSTADGLYAPKTHNHTWSQITGAPIYTTRWATKSEVGLGNVNNWGATTSTSSTSTTTYATASAVKSAYDRGTSALNTANSKWTAVNASTSTRGIVQLSTSTSSTSTSTAATSSAVKEAYDLANIAMTTQVFQGADPDNIAFPIGTIISVYGTTVARNASKTIYLRDGVPGDYALTGSVRLEGLWVSRGYCGGSYTLFQCIS